MAEDFDAIKEEMHKLTAEASKYANQAISETNAAKRKILDDNVSRLNAEIQALADKLPVTGSAGAPKRFTEQDKQQRKQERLKLRKAVGGTTTRQELPKLLPIEQFDKRTEELKQAAKKLIAAEPARQQRLQQIAARKQGDVGKAAKEVLKDIGKTPTKTVGQVKSSSEKLADLALKEAQRASQQSRNPTLPTIPKDTATEIVIASIAITFLILAGAATKFSELWTLAFGTGSGKGVGDFQGAGPALANESWDIPNAFHGMAS